MTIAIGIDPGTSGAVAAVCSQRGVLEVARMPVENIGRGKVARNVVHAGGLIDMLRDWHARHEMARDTVVTVCERVDAFPGLTGASAISLGDAAGAARVALSLFSEPVLVKPAVWKRLYGLKADKKQAKSVALALYGAQLPKVFSHDKAEAVLIARWRLKQGM